MRIELKESLLVIIPESPSDRDSLARWSTDCGDHLFSARVNESNALILHDRGPELEVTREPINVTSAARDEQVRLISNLAHTPFELDGEAYASVEGFWQSLKLSEATERRRVAELAGHQARNAGLSVPYGASVAYQGRVIRTGCWEHWQLMRSACWAKFSQHVAARDALLATGSRPLAHRVRRDSRTIPGVIMAEIWMAIRARLPQAK